MADRYVRIVSLWIHTGQEAAFEAFEREAARIMARHGGRIDSAVRLVRFAEFADPPPYEIHFVSFPDKAAADSYAVDPETTALRVKRSQIISKTSVMEGRDVGPY